MDNFTIYRHHAPADETRRVNVLGPNGLNFIVSKHLQLFTTFNFIVAASAAGSHISHDDTENTRLPARRWSMLAPLLSLTEPCGRNLNGLYNGYRTARNSMTLILHNR